jgi:hypothetical protein
MRDRANAAHANLQRKAYALSILRSRVESRINAVLSSGGASNSAQELGRLLDLVKNGELILRDMSEKVESARFLEEYIQIISGAAESVNEIKDDVEELVPVAEAALTQMHEVISHVSSVMSSGSKEEIDPSILAQVSAEIAFASSNSRTEISKREGEIQDSAQASAEKEQLEEVAI